MTRRQIYAVVVGGGVGAILGLIYSLKPGDLPGAFVMAKRLGSPLFWGALAAYFALGYLMLWAFQKPKDAAQWGVLAVSGFLWNAF